MSDIFNDRHLSENEDTIASTINYLKLNDPDNANRDYAVGFLKYMERVAFQVEKKQDLNYDDFLKEYKESDS
jgi:hypothetical protein